MRKKDLQLKYDHAQDAIRDLVIENGKLRDQINDLKSNLGRCYDFIGPLAARVNRPLMELTEAIQRMHAAYWVPSEKWPWQA